MENPKIVVAPSPLDPARLILLEVDLDACRKLFEMNARAKLGEYAGLVHGDVPLLMDHPPEQRGMRGCYALFQGLDRPLNKDLGGNLCIYVSAPPCTFRFDNPYGACEAADRPASSVFVTYVEFPESLLTMSPASGHPQTDTVLGRIRFWEWVPAESLAAVNPSRSETAPLQLPLDHGRRYKQRRWVK